MGNINTIIRRNGKASLNNVAAATGADKGILHNISTSLTSGNFKELSVDILEDFPEHKFNIYSDDELKALSDNIKMVGLLDPITVWDDSKGHYYILCGHNRVRACKLAGLKTVTCNVKKYNNINEAKLAVIASNIDRRGGFECLSLEEKCQVIVDDFETLKELYKQDKEKYGIAEVIGFDAKKEVAVHYKLGARQAAIYYKIGKTFKKDWLKLMPRHFNIKTAYQLAQLKRDNLKEIMDNIIVSEQEDKFIVKVNESQAKVLKQMENEGKEISDMVSFLYTIDTKKQEKKSYQIDFSNEVFSPFYKKIQKLDDETLRCIFSDALKAYFDKE